MWSPSWPTAETFTGAASCGLHRVEATSRSWRRTPTEPYMYKRPDVLSPGFFGRRCHLRELRRAGATGRPGGKRPSSVRLVCVEADACKEVERIGDRGRRRTWGFEHVYKGRASLGQPDYTAECLSARPGRRAGPADRLGRHRISNGWPTAVPAQKLLPDLQQRNRGSRSRTGSKMWRTSPSVVAHHQRVPLVPNRGRGRRRTSTVWRCTPTPRTSARRPAGHERAWGRGAKLFERGHGQTCRSRRPPRPIFDGLYSLKDETLGGL